MNVAPSLEVASRTLVPPGVSAVDPLALPLATVRSWQAGSATWVVDVPPVEVLVVALPVDDVLLVDVDPGEELPVEVAVDVVLPPEDELPPPHAETTAPSTTRPMARKNGPRVKHVKLHPRKWPKTATFIASPPLLSVNQALKI